MLKYLEYSELQEAQEAPLLALANVIPPQSNSIQDQHFPDLWLYYQMKQNGAHLSPKKKITQKVF